MNTLKNIVIVALISIPMISFASDSKQWERNMEKRQSEQAPPTLVEGAASKMGHTAVEHKRYILGENYPGLNYNIPFAKKNRYVKFHTDHMGVDHKRQMLGENR